MNIEHEAQKEVAFRKWLHNSACMRPRLGVAHDWTPWTSSASLHGVPKHVSRVPEVLDIGFIQKIQEAQKRPIKSFNALPCNPEAIKVGYWTDYSQVLQRKPAGSLPTLHTNAFVYSHEQDVALPGTASLGFHGYPSDLDLSGSGNCAHSHSSNVRDLMGASFSLPCGAPAVVAACMTLASPWRWVYMADYGFLQPLLLHARFVLDGLSLLCRGECHRAMTQGPMNDTGRHPRLELLCNAAPWNNKCSSLQLFTVQALQSRPTTAVAPSLLPQPLLRILRQRRRMPGSHPPEHF